MEVFDGYSLVNNTFYEAPINPSINLDNIAQDDLLTPDSLSIYYKWVTSSFSSKYDAAQKRRVSPLYEKAKSMLVTNSLTLTRSITEGATSTVQQGLPTIDASVTVSYSVSVTASSSTLASVTGTFEPSGKYTYSAIVFTPNVATVKGDYQMWQNFDGVHSKISSNICTLQYPVKGTSSSILDGIYAMMESNSTSGFPSLA